MGRLLGHDRRGRGYLRPPRTCEVLGVAGEELAPPRALLPRHRTAAPARPTPRKSCRSSRRRSASQLAAIASTSVMIDSAEQPTKN